LIGIVPLLLSLILLEKLCRSYIFAVVIEKGKKDELYSKGDFVET